MTGFVREFAPSSRRYQKYLAVGPSTVSAFSCTSCSPFQAPLRKTPKPPCRPHDRRLGTLLLCSIGGSLEDVWEIDDSGSPMAILSGITLLSSCIEPMIGGWIDQKAGWRWLYWVLFTSFGATFNFTLLIFEILPPVLRPKGVKLRREAREDKYRTLEELEKKPVPEVIEASLTRPFLMIFTKPIVIFTSIYLSFV